MTWFWDLGQFLYKSYLFYMYFSKPQEAIRKLINSYLEVINYNHSPSSLSCLEVSFLSYCERYFDRQLGDGRMDMRLNMGKGERWKHHLSLQFLGVGNSKDNISLLVLSWFRTSFWHRSLKCTDNPSSTTLTGFRGYVNTQLLMVKA